MATNYKQIATADVLTADLALQLNLTVTQTQADAVNVKANASGGTSPVITVGTVTTTNGGVTIVVADQRSGPGTAAYPTYSPWTDIIGNSQPVYTGTVYKVIFEKDLTTTQAAGILNKVLAILGKRGGAIELWAVNSGQSANLSGAGLAYQYTIDNNMYRPLEDRA